MKRIVKSLPLRLPSIALLTLGLLVTAAPAQEQPTRNTPRQALERTVTVNLDGATAEQSFKWLAAAADFNLIINWDQLEQLGYDREAEVELKLKSVPARVALRLLMADVFDDENIMAEVTPHYIRIRTREQLNAEPVIKLYDVGDLLMAVPHFDNAPAFDLNEVTGADSAQGGGSGDSVFADVDTDSDQAELPKSERVEQLIATITTTVEPDIWQRNGGTEGTISFFQNKLVIRAPEYVHPQIGTPIGSIHNPRVSVASEGATLDARAAVSPRDPRYVRFSTAGATQVQSVRLREFRVSTIDRTDRNRPARVNRTPRRFQASGAISGVRDP